MIVYMTEISILQMTTDICCNIDCFPYRLRLSPAVTFHRIRLPRNTTGGTGEAVAAYPSGSSDLDLVFRGYVGFKLCMSVNVFILLFLFYWLWPCLSSYLTIIVCTFNIFKHFFQTWIIG